MMRALPKGSGFTVLLALVAVIPVPSVAGAALSTVLASVEASLERCRSTVTQHRSTLSTCTAARVPVGGNPCNCLCPTCLPEEWPHRKEPPPCTTPPPPPGPRKTTPPPPPPTAPPPPPLPPLKVLPPYTEENLPTLGPWPATAQPTTTTIDAPIPPPGECLDDGIYRGDGTYAEIGQGLCIDDDKLAISFKKRRELNEQNYQCYCKEACDKEPGCIGYSINALDDGDGLACRVYGWDLPGLTDRWIDLESVGNPRYKGKKIVGANGAKGQTCYKKVVSEGEKAFNEEQAKKKEDSLLLRISKVEKAMPLPPPQLNLPPPTSFVVREISTSDTLSWQREQLTRCREQEASLVSLLKQKGCHRSSVASGLRRSVRGLREERIMPNECQCHCPACNFWQLPPPVCLEPTPKPTVTIPPPPPGVIVVTGPPRAPTPPPLPVQLPLPQLPPIGEQFLPTLGPPPAPEKDD